MVTVLIIDDNDDIREMLTIVLESAGYATIVACDGDTGIRRFEAERPEVVLTDILMPNCDGLETITRLRSMDPDVPIAAMSGGSRIGAHYYLDVAKKTGATAVLPKPFKIAELLTIIEWCLHAHPAPCRPNDTGKGKRLPAR